jgi:hypothetical protein
MKDIIRMNQLAGIITEGQARKMMQVLNENEKPDSISMMVFLEGLGISPKDPLFASAIKTGNIYEVISLLVDTAGNGDTENPFDGVYTQSDFYKAAQDAQFSQEMIDDILDMEEIQNLEKG